MDIILLQTMDKLGDKHDVVSVKPGYGRNYLIPQGFAVIANAANRKKLEKLIEEEKANENALLCTS
jgi:large subunit ribosomal protein L9